MHSGHKRSSAQTAYTIQRAPPHSIDPAGTCFTQEQLTNWHGEQSSRGRDRGHDHVPSRSLGRTATAHPPSSWRRDHTMPAINPRPSEGGRGGTSNLILRLVILILNLIQKAFKPKFDANGLMMQDPDLLIFQQDNLRLNVMICYMDACKELCSIFKSEGLKLKTGFQLMQQKNYYDRF